MQKTSQKKRKLTLFVIIFLIISAVITVYALFDPAETTWFPKCIIHTTTGFKCPGCGSQRAIHAILQGDIISAFRFNALFILLIPILAATAVSEIWSNRFQWIYIHTHKKWMGQAFIGLIIVWMIIRNLVHI